MDADDNGGVNPLEIPPAVVECARQVADEIEALTGVPLDAVEILTGRAALLHLAPAGRVSAGGATHLLRALDGWCALTLSRIDDIAAVPALLDRDEAPTPWLSVRHWAATRTISQVLERARLLDIPVAALGETAAAPPRTEPLLPASEPRGIVGLLVADLTSMWAGPLCGHLLARAGAVVVKVESPRRPDGTRSGNGAFFNWMNSGKLSYAVDFDANTEQVRALLSAADVVLEGSRPAALIRRGLGPHDIVGRPGRVWLRITGYGAQNVDGFRPAFGDDAAVAGGLIRWTADGPGFCGDAIADPLTGLTAARAVIDALARGGGQLIDIAMAAVAATYAALPPSSVGAPVHPIRPAHMAAASALGADNAAVDRLIAESSSATC